MADVTITQLALELHTDLANIKIYEVKSPAVTRALIAEADKKLAAINDYLKSVHRETIMAEGPIGWGKIDASTDQAA